MIRSLVLLTLVLVMLIPAYSPVQAHETAYTCNQYRTIVRGDTLYRIARNNGTTIARLQEVNHMGNRTRIYVGETLCVRFSSASSPTGTIYTVQRGDTLSRIARRYGVDMMVLARVNNIANVNRIYAGQRLIIPDFTTQVGS